MLVNLSHPSVGSQTGIRVDPAELDADETVELVLDPGAKLSARILDGLEPLGGIHLFIYDRTGAFLPGTLASDESGRVTSGPLEEGEYLAVIHQPGVWNVEQPIQATSDGDVAEIQVRRLGDLNFSVETAMGSPAGGVPLELLSEEFGASVADWIQADRIEGPPGGLKTDALGRLSVVGLPRGAYTCSAGSQGSSAAASVPAKATANLTLTLP